MSRLEQGKASHSPLFGSLTSPYINLAINNNTREEGCSHGVLHLKQDEERGLSCLVGGALSPILDILFYFGFEILWERGLST